MSSSKRTRLDCPPHYAPVHHAKKQRPARKRRVMGNLQSSTPKNAKWPPYVITRIDVQLNEETFDVVACPTTTCASRVRGSPRRPSTMSQPSSLEVDGKAVRRVASTASLSDDVAPTFRSDPFGWYAVKSVQRPRLVFASAWFFIILLCAAGMPLFKQTETTNYDWLLGQNKVVSRSYALSKMQEETSTYTSLAERSVPQSDQLLHFMYESQDADQNLLKPEILKEILAVEKTYFMDSKFAMYCAAEVADPGTCSAKATQTFLNFFYDLDIIQDANNETIANFTAKTDANGDASIDTEAGIQSVLESVMADTDLGPIAALFFDTGFSAVNLKARFVQSFYFLGLPLQGYANPSVQPEEQRKPGNEYIIEMSETLKKKFGMKETFSESAFQSEAVSTTADGSFKMYWWSIPVQENEWLVLSDKDLGWTMLSFIGVGCYVAYHTGSIIISAVSMAMTVFSIFTAFFFFRVIFQVTFFQFINFLIIFVVLGIGADDVFVFMDAFHQSIDELRAKNVPPTLPNRIKHTMRRALHAIFVTSFTTSAAFLATSLSPLIPLRSFGIFSALVIFCVFFINAVILPPLTVMYARNMSGRGWITSAKAMTCGLFPIAKYEDPGEKLPETKETAETAETTSTSTPNTPNVAGKYDVAKMRRTEKFFYVTYFNLLKGPAKWVILVIFASIFAAGIWLWVNLEVPKDPEQWFPGSHMFQQYQGLGTSKIMLGGGAASELDVNIVWGLDGLDDAGTDPWLPSDLGVPKYDANFDPSTAAAQVWLMATYEALKTAACDAKACSGGLLIDPLRPIRNVVAETDDDGTLNNGFYLWLRATYPNDYATADPTTNPITGDAFNQKLCTYSKLDETKVRYPSHVGYYTNDCDESPAPAPKFILIESTSSIRMPQAAVDFETAQGQWAAFTDFKNAGAPTELSGAKETSTNVFWLWSVTSLSLMDNVYLGLAVCFPGVFLVLTLSTGNVVLAFYSTVTIAGIVTTVIGVGAGGIMGWDLGTTEAIAAVITIGFSVDYCVHLANAYIENDAKDRETRTRIALTTMGISVTAGAITTIIAGAFLGLCILTFFVKFSFLICWTIISSYMWAVVFFGALCMAMGPAGDFGDIGFLMRKIPGCRSYGLNNH